MVASYVPVFGTAISLVINTSVSLAQGERIDQSLLDGIGGALPEQPASGMAFNAAVAIAKGERLDQVAIDALPIDRSVRDVLKVADEIVFGIASGQSITDVAYNTIRNRLPPDARQGLDLARRVANGENIPQMVLTEAEQMVVNGVKDRARAIIDEARSQGADAISAAQIEVDRIFNQYAVECGYQMALDRLPDDARGWVQLGLVGGAALKDSMPFVGTFGSVAESNAVENDSYETKGRKLIAAGIRYRNRLVSDILSASTFSVVIDFYDSLNGVWTKRSMSYENTAAWRRGFVIAIGVCEGSSQRGPGQLAVYQTLAEAGGRAGFDAGQAVQYNRTLGGDSGLMVTGVKVEDGSHFIQKIVPNFVNLSPDTATALAKREGVAVEFVHAQSENDIFGADLQMLSSGDGVNRAHPDAEIVVNVQRPLPGATLDPGTSVSLGVALAPGVEP
jgi:hypothetical protein